MRNIWFNEGWICSEATCDRNFKQQESGNNELKQIIQMEIYFA